TKSGYFGGIDAGGGRPGALSLLDRRTAWQPLLAALFPALDRSELAAAAKLQLPSGEPARGTGLLNDGYAAGGFSGLAPHSPDVGCGFTLQVARAYPWTGDAGLLTATYPAVVKTLAWLRTLDTDGDGIPDGG